MYEDVSLYDFRQRFKDYERKNFSYEGLEALYDYLIDIEESCDESIKLDVIALCCEYTEYEDIEEATKELYPDEEPNEALFTIIAKFEHDRIIIVNE